MILRKVRYGENVLNLLSKRLIVLLEVSLEVHNLAFLKFKMLKNRHNET